MGSAARGRNATTDYGSRDDWLEGRGLYLSVMGAIDHATGKVPYVLFRDKQDAQGYTLLLRHIVEKGGIREGLRDCGHLPGPSEE
ncbi:MAG: hypothetical protein ACUVTR_02690 [Dehalococcoidia bacterium]